MSIVFNADYPGAGFVAPAWSVQWGLGIAGGEGAVDFVERQLAGDRPARRSTDRDGAEPAPETPLEIAGSLKTQDAVRKLLAVYGEDEARDHFEVRGVESRDPIERYDMALIDPVAEAEPESAPHVAEFAPVHPPSAPAILSAEDFLLL